MASIFVIANVGLAIAIQGCPAVKLTEKKFQRRNLTTFRLVALAFLMEQTHLKLRRYGTKLARAAAKLPHFRVAARFSLFA